MNARSSTIDAGVQESTFYSMNHSIDVNDGRRGQDTPLTQTETVYFRNDLSKIGSKRREDKNGTNLGSLPRKKK